VFDPIEETSPSGEALGPDQHVVVACKVVPAVTPATVQSTFPLVIDVETGNEIGPGIDQVGGGDEVNYNPGDNRFVVSFDRGGRIRKSRRTGCDQRRQRRLAPKSACGDSGVARVLEGG
jgi:hypothetical protein